MKIGPAVYEIQTRNWLAFISIQAPNRDGKKEGTKHIYAKLNSKFYIIVSQPFVNRFSDLLSLCPTNRYVVDRMTSHAPGATLIRKKLDRIVAFLIVLYFFNFFRLSFTFPLNFLTHTKHWKRWDARDWDQMKIFDSKVILGNVLSCIRPRAVPMPSMFTIARKMLSLNVHAPTLFSRVCVAQLAKRHFYRRAAWISSGAFGKCPKSYIFSV